MGNQLVRTGHPRRLLLTAALTLLLFSGASQAVIIIKATDAAWINPIPGGISNLDFDTGPGDADAEISWGNPTDTLNSAYFIDGDETGSEIVLPTMIGEMTDLIEIGEFTHRNKPVTGTPLGGVTLSLGLSLVDGGDEIFAGTFEFFFDHTETLNTGTCPEGPDGESISVCDDFVEISEPEAQTFMLDGMLFDIDLTFAILMEDVLEPSSAFQTQEDAFNDRLLAVKFTKVPVPEPATLGMLGLGLLALGAAAKRKRAARDS